MSWWSPSAFVIVVVFVVLFTSVAPLMKGQTIFSSQDAPFSRRKLDRKCRGHLLCSPVVCMGSGLCALSSFSLLEGMYSTVQKRSSSCRQGPPFVKGVAMQANGRPISLARVIWTNFSHRGLRYRLTFAFLSTFDKAHNIHQHR